MNSFKNFMSFSRSERIAILTIVSMIVIILIIKYIIINNPPKREYFKHDLDSIVARRDFVMDSIRIADSIEKAAKLSFRPKRNEMKHSGEILKKTTQLKKEDSSTPLRYARNDNVAVACEMIDINVADTNMLKQLPGIGSAYAKWIVEYRNKLGGYCESEQLLEVYRMDTVRYSGIKDFVKIDSTFTPNKLKINSESFKVLLKHPYLEYEDVKKIVNHREQKGLIVSWEQLMKIVGNDVNPQLRYYIDYQ